MNSVITEYTDGKIRTVFYDANCGFCRVWVRWAGRILKRRGFEFSPLPEPVQEFKVVKASGQIVGGADAHFYLARQIWWASPLWALSRVPGVMRMAHRVYRWIAHRRYCLPPTNMRRPLRSLTRRWS